jgi:bifunctional UDP-N-acetylglucosamine pyrophosphorylase/glucosamine-1-phosphate N-acetyltransferase
MRSGLAKVLHPLCGRPMAGWAVEAARQAGCSVSVVVGHQADAVREALPGCSFALQDPPLGTGHAVQCALDALPQEGTVVVMPGDAPLIRAETLDRLLSGHEGLCTVLTMVVDQPGAYGRFVRAEKSYIVEAANASPKELAVTEVNSGVYAFDAAWLRQQIQDLKPHPPKGEYYLTDVIEAASEAGALNAVIHPDPDEMMGVNDRVALSVAEERLRQRINRGWMAHGVTLRDPRSTYIDVGVRLERDVRVEPGALLTGSTVVETGSVIGPNSVLHDTHVGPNCVIKPMVVCNGARLGAEVAVGPMARLREGTVVEDTSKIGNFVETKKAHLGVGVKAGHLSYLGDCSIGAKTNIGAGTITCNYDGWGKHHTEIGEGAFIGSNASLVAPVTIGEGAIVGAGSVVTEAVGDEDLAIGRGRQKNLKGAASKVHARNKKRAGK